MNEAYVRLIRILSEERSRWEPTGPNVDKKRWPHNLRGTPWQRLVGEVPETPKKKAKKRVTKAKVAKKEKRDAPYWARVRLGSELLGGEGLTPAQRRKIGTKKKREEREQTKKRKKAAARRAEAQKNAPPKEWDPEDDDQHWL